MTKKVGLTTLGCRVNQYESDYFAERFKAAGFEIVGLEPGCDIYLVNTCTVTAESDRKCRQAIRRAAALAGDERKKGRRCIAAAAGCYVQGALRPTLEAMKGIDFFCGNAGKASLPDRLMSMLESGKAEGYAVSPISSVRGYEETGISESEHVRAYVKIEDGCDSFCSYCYVPFVRGRVRSRPEADTLAEVGRLAANGYKEIVLTGIEVGAYGVDSGEKNSLCRIAEKISKISGVERIRFGSLNPSLITREFVSSLVLNDKIMPHFHLSVQSGSSRVLESMRRGYDKARILEAFALIRSFYTNAAISADIICGFPGETDGDFHDTYEVCEKGQLLNAHIFPYSPRRNTAAAAMDGQIPAEIKKARCDELAALHSETRKRFVNSQTGENARMLIEKLSEGKSFGHTENYIYVSLPRQNRDTVGEIREFIFDPDYVINPAIK